jgi:alkylated DNA repair protein (DNA oxidative demethylase)
MGATDTSQIDPGERSRDMAFITPTTRRGGARSRSGGIPTTLAAHDRADGGARQLSLDLAAPATVAEPQPMQVHTWRDDVVHVANWLDASAQRRLVADFREWALPPAGLRHPRVPTGHLMSVQSVCLGWHWQPYAYSRTADDTDGAPVKPLPDDLVVLARAAVDVAYGAGTAGSFAPDAVIANLYTAGARLGLHRDGEEPSEAPVVTISIGDACTFRLAGVDRRTGPFVDITLRSGDLLVFGGANRRIYHGVPKVFPGTAPPGIGLDSGRLSITVRETGLSG